MRLSGKAVALCLAAALTAGGAAGADGVPAPGTYQCRSPDGAIFELSFTVGPDAIYSNKRGGRGTMTIDPDTGNVLFHGAAPQSGFQGRYSAGPPPQVVLLTVKAGVVSDAGIVCRMN